MANTGVEAIGVGISQVPRWWSETKVRAQKQAIPKQVTLSAKSPTANTFESYVVKVSIIKMLKPGHWNEIWGVAGFGQTPRIRQKRHIPGGKGPKKTIEVQARNSAHQRKQKERLQTKAKDGKITIDGWWLGHPSEKYESQLGWLATQYMGK